MAEWIIAQAWKACGRHIGAPWVRIPPRPHIIETHSDKKGKNMSGLNYPTLVLNADFSPVSVNPLSVWRFDKTLRNFLKDKIIPLEHYDDVFKSQSWEYRPPSVVALKEYVKVPQGVAFNRINIFLRDKFRCQYCGQHFKSVDLTFDHVIPKSQGGKTDFENIVAACVPCNTHKGDRLDLKPIREPRVPTRRELEKFKGESIDIRNIHKTWHDYLYWSGVIDPQ